MTNENQDLLDICRLNQMEDRITEDCVDPEKETVLRLIDREKRVRMTRMKHNPPSVPAGVMEDHIKSNTDENGVYPWTEGVAGEVE